MTIRRARESDIPAVLRLLRQVCMVHHAGRPDLFRAGGAKYDEAALREIFRDDARPVFVYDEGGEALGYAFCVHQQYVGHPVMTDVRTLYIDDLCVDEACRGRGVGQALYRHVLEYARASGCYNVTLNVWARNAAALRFYEKCGLTPQKIGMETIL